MDSSSTSSKLEVAHDVFPYLVEYKDGTIERLAGTNHVPPGFDPTTGVTSKDVVLVPDTCLSARIYRPSGTTNCEKLPLVMYFHGGAFLIASPAEPVYHNFCNLFAGSAKALVVSLDYRRAPEYPLPTAFDDAWAAINWMAAHAHEGGPEEWLNQGADFNKVFLVGDSAGATMAHHVAARMTENLNKVKIYGIILIHPYFWSSKPIGLLEKADPIRKELVDKWWQYVCPSDEGCDDPLINPFVDGAPSFDKIMCGKMLVLVAEKDILRDRGKLYYDTMSKHRKVEYFETQGEDHVFFIFNPHFQKAKTLMSKLAFFINNQS